MRFVLRWLAAGFLLGVGLFTGNALASHQFSDVSGGFHSEISWLVNNNIATGFGDGTFRPQAGITRGQAAYWFSNYNDASAQWHQASVTVSSNAANLTHTDTCPNGKRPVAGGGIGDKPYLFIRTSHPTYNFSEGRWRGWLVTWNVAGAPSFPENVTLTVYALCAPQAS